MRRKCLLTVKFFLTNARLVRCVIIFKRVKAEVDYKLRIDFECVFEMW